MRARKALRRALLAGDGGTYAAVLREDIGRRLAAAVARFVPEMVRRGVVPLLWMMREGGSDG